MMPPSSQLVSIVTGLAVGNVFGVYLAQTYELPNLQGLVEDLFSRAKQYEKSTRKSDDDKEQ